MLITDKFVFLHLPKTGGTFVTRVLENVYEIMYARNPAEKPFFENLIVANIKRLHTKQKSDQHGTYQQIPEKHKHKLIFAVMRNPFDRYVSAFEFREWKRNPSADEKTILQMFPTFPNLNFEQYLFFSNSIGLQYRPFNTSLGYDIGLLSFQFIQMFFKNPEETIKLLSDDYIMSKCYKQDMPEILFLRMENLNVELYNLLLQLGYLNSDINFILTEGKILPPGSARTSNQKWQKYYTKELVAYIMHKERLLFEMFPEYNYMVEDS